MILVDTSVWIDFFRGTHSAETRWLASALKNDEDLCICGMVLTEILQGIDDRNQYRRVKRSLDALLFLPTTRVAYELAAEIYRAAKRAGKTVRNSVDCIIAACAIVNKASLVQCDRDYRTLAGVSKLKLVSSVGGNRLKAGCRPERRACGESEPWLPRASIRRRRR